MPSAKDSLKAKIAAFKAKVEPNSISPSYLGSILDNIVDESGSGGTSQPDEGPCYVEFYGFVSNYKILQVSITASSQSDGYRAYYDLIKHVFILIAFDSDGTVTDLAEAGHNNWLDADDFGSFTANGRKPYVGRLYADRSENRLYRADENGHLVTMNSDHIQSIMYDNSSSDKYFYHLVATGYSGAVVSTVKIPKPFIQYHANVDASKTIMWEAELIGVTPKENVDGYQVLFLEQYNTFVLGKQLNNTTYACYLNWDTAEIFGTSTANGIRPYSDKVYINQSTDTIHVGRG